MATRQEFELVADGVDIETLWSALTKDKINIIRKAAPNLVRELTVLEGHGIALGSLLCVRFGPAAPDELEPYKERITEFDETKHMVTFVGEEGGYMNLGFSKLVLSAKLDDVGGGNTMVNLSLTYDLEENFINGGGQHLDGLLKLLRNYLDSVISYLQQKHA